MRNTFIKRLANLLDKKIVSDCYGNTKRQYANVQSYFEQAQTQFESFEGYEGIAETLEAFVELHTAQKLPHQSPYYSQQTIEHYKK